MRFSKPSPAMIVALISLVFAMTGTGIAARGLITTKQIKNSAVTSAKIRDSAVTTKKIRKGAVTKDKIATGVIPTIPAAPDLGPYALKGDLSQFAAKGDVYSKGDADARYAAHGTEGKTVTPGTDDAANGAALADVIATAPDANSADPYVIRLEPGIYFIGDREITLPPGVQVIGAGDRSTTVSADSGRFIVPTASTSVLLAGFRMNGSGTALVTVDGEATLENLSLQVIGTGTIRGVDARDGQVKLDEINVSANGTTAATGVEAHNPAISDSTIGANSTSGTAAAIKALTPGAGAGMVLDGVTTSAAASGGTNGLAYGVYLEIGAYGSISDSHIAGGGAAGTAAVFAAGGTQLHIDGSFLDGRYSAYGLRTGGQGTWIGATRIDGGVNTPSALNVQCAASYDNYAVPLANDTCA